MRVSVLKAAFLTALLTVGGELAHAQKVIRYPKVYGSTGRPYGPTQANYQYARQYGRAWHGSGGSTAIVAGSGAAGYPRVYGNFAVYGCNPKYVYGVYPGPFGFYGGAYGGFGGYPSYVTIGNVGFVGTAVPPPVFQPNPILGGGPAPGLGNPVIEEALNENDARWNGPLAIQPKAQPKERIIPPSTPAMKQKSLHAQGQGDHWFRKRNYQRAYDRYKQAARHAEDLGAPRFRMGMALVAMGRFQEAVGQFKRGLKQDPKWPEHGRTLTEVFNENHVSRLSIKHQVAEWVREDIRDPDRLFLFGIVLHFDDDERSANVFEAALRLAGQGDHLVAFLDPNQVGQPAPGEPVPAGQQLPADEPLPADGLNDGQPQQPLLPPLPAPAQPKPPLPAGAGVGLGNGHAPVPAPGNQGPRLPQ